MPAIAPPLAIPPEDLRTLGQWSRSHSIRAALGVTHWSTRLLADQLGVSHPPVPRVWAEYDLQPWRTETFKFSTDPQLEAKVRDVVGLYLQPPERAIVVC